MAIPDGWPPTGADRPRPDQAWRLNEDMFLVWDDAIGQYIEVGPDIPATYFELPAGAVELVPVVGSPRRLGVG